MITLPSTVKVGGLEYEMQFHTDLSRETSTYGLTNHDEQYIYIDPTRKDDRQLETFLHELLHCVFYANGLSNRLKDIKGIEEEDIIKPLSRGLFTVINDNKIDFIVRPNLPAKD